MRFTLTKNKTTKSERIMIRLLQENRIPFRFREKVIGKEVDFLIGKTIIEINGHDQDEIRNNLFVENGYTPYHFSNDEVKNNGDKIIKILSHAITI